MKMKSSEADQKTQPCDRDGDREKEVGRLGNGDEKWNASKKHTCAPRVRLQVWANGLKQHRGHLV